ncbi:hypothetical protein J1N35_030021 [Gossypium stocksii]|uniref:Uncharacterized protein n=1 Tax=Gossypium stocksii TaxID=47602 RepID=A0A9D3ZUB4_9ROSI|nr:hypothetical protein J1N35_030021 [Gossypium stocksii]
MDKYSKPITVTAIIDIGAAETNMNSKVLLTEWWKPLERIFNSVVDQPFVVGLDKTSVSRSKLPREDIVIGFDLTTKAQHLRILLDGI